MNYRLFIFTIIIGFFFIGCANIKIPNVMEREPDILTKDTYVKVSQETPVFAPKDTEVKTDSETRTTAYLTEDIRVEVDEPKKTEPREVVLPKNTEIELPPNTKLITESDQVFVLEEQSEVILSQGTEVKTTVINWYALLFYILAIAVIGWHYIQIRKEIKKKN
jgi:hypothetical protein